MPDKLYSIRMRAERNGSHISGAEGIYGKKELLKVIGEYARRALSHSKGAPDLVNLKIEPLRERPLVVRSLPVFTIKTNGPKDAIGKGISLLKGIGISEKAIGSALKAISSGTMKGAALISYKTGKRIDSYKEKGIRASCLGIRGQANRKLVSLLEEKGLSHPRVKEALILASKVASAPGVIAELCISDDPDYTTGYVALSQSGYFRLPRIKRKGAGTGGRVFFLKEDAPLRELLRYLRETPVLIGKISPVGGIISIYETKTPCGPHREPCGKKGVGKKSGACPLPLG